MYIWHYNFIADIWCSAAGNSTSTSPAISRGRRWQTWHCGSFHSSVGTALLHNRSHHFRWGWEVGCPWHPWPPLLNPSLHLFITAAPCSTRGDILERNMWEVEMLAQKLGNISSCIAQENLKPHSPVSADANVPGRTGRNCGLPISQLSQWHPWAIGSQNYLCCLLRFVEEHSKHET